MLDIENFEPKFKLNTPGTSWITHVANKNLPCRVLTGQMYRVQGALGEVDKILQLVAMLRFRQSVRS